METFVIMGAALSVRQIIVLIRNLVNDILTARQLVRKLPEEIEKLVEVVEQVNPVVVKIQAEADDKDDFLKPYLNNLGRELVLAWEKKEEFERKLGKQMARPEFINTAVALLDQGAVKQHKKIKIICQNIDHQRVELDRALTVGTHLTVDRIERSVETLHEKVDLLDLDRNANPVTLLATPKIIADLDLWAVENLDNEIFRVDLLIAKSHTNEFFAPGLAYLGHTTDSGLDEGETTRGAREGGLEVEDSTKVQFHIRTHEDCFLYVLGFEKNLTIPSNLELIFPKYAKYKNKVLRDVRRKFPDKKRYITDPENCKVEKSASLGDGVIGQVLVYIVLTAEPIVQDGMQEVDISYIETQLNQSKSEGANSVFVKRFLFDVK